MTSPDEEATPTAHPAVAALAERLRALPWVSGLYVAGSLATGDHVPGVSDLDLVALTGAAPETGVLTEIHEELDAGIAAGSDLGCVYVPADQLDDHDAAHPTWTHGHLVHRPLSAIPRAELALHGLTVFGDDVRTAFPRSPRTTSEMRHAARSATTGPARSGTRTGGSSNPSSPSSA